MNKIVIADHASRKYKINECLLSLPVAEYRAALRFLPKYLGISLNTFHNYRNILLNDTQDIPHEKVMVMEKLFELKPGELCNKMIYVKTLKEFLQEGNRH